MKINPDGTKDLTPFIGEINRRFGEGTICLAKDVKAVAIRRIPTCSFYHDYIIGGGTYMGGIVEVTGPYQSGKTWFAVKTGAVNQKLCNRCNTPFVLKKQKKRIKEGGKVVERMIDIRVCPGCNDYEERVFAFVDAEHSAMSALANDGWLKYAKEIMQDDNKRTSVLFRFFKTLGVDTDRMLYQAPRNSEEGYEVVDRMLKKRQANIIVYDSLAASLTGDVLDKEMEQASMAPKARLNNKFVRKLITRFNDGSLTDPNNIAWCSLILINQLSTDLSAPRKPGQPPITKATGGLGVGYMALERIKVLYPEKHIINKDFKGFIVHAEIYKDKQGIPFGRFSFNIFLKDIPEFNIKKHCVDENSEIFEVAIINNYFNQSGGWFTFNGVKYQGKDKLQTYLLKNKKYFKEIKNALLKTVNNAG